VKTVRAPAAGVKRLAHRGLWKALSGLGTTVEDVCTAWVHTCGNLVPVRVHLRRDLRFCRPRDVDRRKLGHPSPMTGRTGPRSPARGTP